MALTQIRDGGLVLEFGVFQGVSINFFASRLPRRNLWGFDSFTGLKEDWLGTSVPVKAMDLGGKLPRTAPNVTLHAGWFDQTLPRFLDGTDAPVDFVHFDADTFEATELVLELLARRIAPGAVLLFDEFHSLSGWRNGEFRAWGNFCEKYNIPFRYLAFGPNQAAVLLS